MVTVSRDIHIAFTAGLNISFVTHISEVGGGGGEGGGLTLTLLSHLHITRSKESI